MSRKTKYHTQEQRKEARRKQRAQRSLKPGAKELCREQNRRAYAKRKLIVVPEPSEIVQSLSSMEISEDSLYEHLYVHHSITAGPLKLPQITLTDADFRDMIGHPPYPSHVIGLPSFEKDWPIISAAFHGYATRKFVLEQTKWMNEAAGRDRASLSSELTKLYRHLMEEWDQFGDDVRKHADQLPTELIAFQNRLWASRRLMWLVEDLRSLVEGTDTLFVTLQARLRHFQ
ncbi:hypothetical protein EST38_g13757 [Candolleomyces aberdarensis]|uniref:Uncharacterized protein n=1 Tax=Candolleomyces aberdarensis TaxID=2316362 RepID=A0A4Q2D1T5_9AGAR|nr:hypothetical protein EST38_g13757 [Candolleomyces aberdarensis]